MKLNILEVIQEAIDYIEENIQNPISVKSVSERTPYSIWQFQRIFRSSVGDSLGNYIRHRRLTLSLEAIQNTDRRIIDIAIDFQFGSQEAFSRAFKNFFGHTPKEIRKKGLKLEGKHKPKITFELLSYFNGGIVMEPEIVKMPERKFIGTEIEAPSHLSGYSEFDSVLIPHWIDFNGRKKEIENRIGQHSIGLAKADSKANEQSMMSYLSAVEVESFDLVPEGMVTYNIPQMTYAVFSNIGAGDKTIYTINYIYGTWLPQSEYERGNADDYEYFDCRYRYGDQNSESEYFLPVKKL